MDVDGVGKLVDKSIRLVISASYMELLCNGAVITPGDRMNTLKAMIDSGANINLAPSSLAKMLGLQITPHTDGRKIGTADSEGSMVIAGWIHPRGYTGPIALVDNAAFTLLAVTELQSHGMGVVFPPCTQSCLLIVIRDGEEVVHTEIQRDGPTKLYFVDITELNGNSASLIIPQDGDYVGPEPKLYGGHAGYCSPCDNPNPEEERPIFTKTDFVIYDKDSLACPITTIPADRRKFYDCTGLEVL